MRFFYKEKKVLNGYITAFGLLMLSYLLVFYTMQQMDKRARMVNHTNEVINNLDILFSCLKDAETTFRGFAITADTTMLDPYRYHINCIGSSTEKIIKLTRGEIFLTANFDTLNRLIEDKKSLLGQTIGEMKSGNTPAYELLAQRITKGTLIMNQIRKLIVRMQTYESEKLARMTMTYESITKTLKVIHFTTFIVALLLVIYSLVVFNNVSRAKLEYRLQLEQGIEKLKVANEDLKNLRSFENFAAGGRIARAIAHEIRNPLTSISLASEQLVSALKSPDDIMLLEMITRNAKRINDLISELLNSTKFSQLNLTRVSLHAIVDEALELAGDRIELNNITLVKNTSPNQCIVEADTEKLRIAFLNLIINAVEAMKPGQGILEITTLRKDDKCLAVFRDNGIGMNDNALSRIFEPYFTMKENGNGLGLTLTQNIILNHKGNITVESKPKKGTTFTITLNNVE